MDHWRFSVLQFLQVDAGSCNGLEQEQPKEVNPDKSIGGYVHDIIKLI